MDKENSKKKTTTNKKTTTKKASAKKAPVKKTTTKKNTVVKKQTDIKDEKVLVKEEVKQEIENKLEIKNNSIDEDKLKDRRKYAIIGSLYIFCSVLWLIGGILKNSNDLGNEYLDYISSFLLLVLGVMYFIKAKNLK